MLDAIRRTGDAALPAPRRPLAHELPELERWLDDGLRRGDSGRLAAEYPLSMGATGSRRHQAIYADGHPLSHAMSHVVTVRARGRLLDLGMIGNVYTDPAARGRGLALACVEAAVEELRSLGAPLAILWGEPGSPLYARAGFASAGREHFFDLTGLHEPGLPPGLEVRPLRSIDLPAIERLHALKPARAERAPGDFAALCSAPGTEVVVAQRDARIEAYAVAGRGDDFQGVVHEWAGAPEAVAACVSRLRERAGAHTVMASPVEEGFQQWLRTAGATGRAGVFALCRILDVEALWRALAPRQSPLHFSEAAGELVLQGEAGRRHALDPAQALELFFGAGVEVLAGLSPRERRELSRVLPWPLYVWGLDSI